jgi:hypothetical protein
VGISWVVAVSLEVTGGVIVDKIMEKHRAIMGVIVGV